MSCVQSVCKQNLVDVNSENTSCVRIRTEDDTEFVVDQNVFARESEYFKKLFKYNTQKEILLQGVTGEAMAVIVEFIENRSLKRMSSENVLDFLKASDYLMLTENIKDALPDSVHEGKCITLFNGTAALLKTLNHGLHVRDMLNIIRSYIVTKFTLVVRHSNIQDISYKDFKQLMDEDNLGVASEETVWESIVRWVESDKSARLKRVQSLLHCMRLKMCGEQFIRKMMNHPIIQQNSGLSSRVTALANARTRRGKSLQTRLMSLLGMSRKRMSLPGRRLQRHATLRVRPTTDSDADGIHIALELTDDPDKSSVVVSRLAGFAPDVVFCCGQSVYMFDAVKNATHYAFDLVSRSWTAVPPPQSSRGLEVKHVTFMTVAGRVFACWISHCIEPYAVRVSVARYSAEAQSWQESIYTYPRTELESGYVTGPVQNFNAAALGDSIVTVGRVGPPGEMRHMFSMQYDVVFGVWSHYLFINPEADTYRLLSSETCLFIFFYESDECIKWCVRDNDIYAQVLEMPFLYQTDPSYGVRCLQTIDDDDDSRDDDVTKICSNLSQLEQLVDSVCPYRRSLQNASFRVTDPKIVSSYVDELSGLMWRQALSKIGHA